MEKVEFEEQFVSSQLMTLKHHPIMSINVDLSFVKNDIYNDSVLEMSVTNKIENHLFRERMRSARIPWSDFRPVFRVQHTVGCSHGPSVNNTETF